MMTDELHVVVSSPDDFATVTGRLESLINKDQAGRWPDIARRATTWDELRRDLLPLIGPSDFMLFLEVDHSSWTALAGHQLKSKMYVIGNPLIAIQVLPHEPAAGLYVPVRIGVHEDKTGRTCISYDRPSVLFAPFGNPEAARVGQLLDEKLQALAQKSAGLV